MIVGSYVEYLKASDELHSKGLVLEINPSYVHVMFTDQNKYNILPQNLKVLDYAPAKLIEYQGNKYLVTAKHNIISLATGKIMLWAPQHGVRRGIMKLYDTSPI